MNLLLLHPHDLIGPDRAVVRDHRFRHMRDTQRVSPGDRLRAGLLNGLIGEAEVAALDEEQITLNLQLDQPAPSPLPLILVLALPRPKMLRRCLRMVAELGIKQLYLINSYRVEKSYWQTPLLGEESLRSALIEGLEQAKDTRLPEVFVRKRFKPFVEDELPELTRHCKALVAHPYGVHAQPVSLPLDGEGLICVGPEGGFIPYEVEKLGQAGCRSLGLGERIYRVETVLPLLVGRLFCTPVPVA